MEKDKRGGGEEGCKDICDRAVYWLANKIVNAAGVEQTTAPHNRFHYTDMEGSSSLRNQLTN